MLRVLTCLGLLLALGQARFYGYPDDVEPELPEMVAGDESLRGPEELVNEPFEAEVDYPGRVASSYAGSHAKEDPEWTRQQLANQASKTSFARGSIAGLAASKDFLYTFHRHNVTWNENSFDPQTNVYQSQNDPIGEDAVYALDLATGEVMFSWGKNTFFMPHGMSVDPQGNIWLTDVALHQAFRYVKNSFVEPDLVLGERFVPGNDDSHFCKPTDVAVSSTGLVYIADGYCNSRVVLFSPSGQYLTEIGRNEGMAIPHSVTLLEIEDLLCVADRENDRVLCYSAGLDSVRPAGQLVFELQPSELHKIYAIGHLGDVILALNGGEEPGERSVGVSIDLATEQPVDVWAPQNGSFVGAHDLSVSPGGASFYVAQLGAAGSEQPRIVKFNLIETRLVK